MVVDGDVVLYMISARMMLMPLSWYAVACAVKGESEVRGWTVEDFIQSSFAPSPHYYGSTAPTCKRPHARYLREQATKVL